MQPERLDIIGICWAAITSIEIAKANAASINVSSRVISIPRNLNPRSLEGHQDLRERGSNLLLAFIHAT